MSNYILNRKQIKSLMSHVSKQLGPCLNCDGTLKHTQNWLNNNIPSDKREAILEEIENDGGFCDCEVVLNCYQD